MSVSGLELEICCETLQACEAAREGGADRIELCSALSEGGVTPSHGLIREAVRVGLPVHVLLRPRGGDFVYSHAEYEAMREDLQQAAALGAAGVVLGLLHAVGTVDRERTQALVELAGPLQVTFHRAFDRTRDLPEALEQVIGSGCGRLLTSGGQPLAPDGAGMLAQLVAQADGRLRIAAGGGVTAEKAPALLARARLDLHASLRSSAALDAVLMGDPLWNPLQGPRPVSVDAVRRLAAVLRTVTEPSPAKA